jgi:hypothetical protein
MFDRFASNRHTLAAAAVACAAFGAPALATAQDLSSSPADRKD